MQTTTSSPTPRRQLPLAVMALLVAIVPSWAQQTVAPKPAGAASTLEKEEEVIVLSPFEVTAGENESYTAATTLAGNRLNTELRDVGNAIQVITAQFLKDTGAVNNETLLQYTTGTEVGNVFGNFTGLGDGAQLNETSKFTNPNQNTRVRGLTSADTTRDYFLSDIPWDGYNIDRVDLSRGPNSILFGQGSPAGVINAGTKSASFRNRAEVEFRYGSEGSARSSIDINRMLIKDQLAVRINGLYDAQKYQQDPAYQDDRRIAGAIRWEPGFLKKGSARTILKANFEKGDIKSNRPRSLPPGDQITPWFYTGTYTGRYSAAGTLIDGTTVAAGAPRVFQSLNHLTTNPHTAQNDNFYRADFPHGLTRPAIAGGPMVGRVNPYYNPWAGSFGASIGGPVAYMANGPVSNFSTYFSEEIAETWGISSTGALDRSLGYDFNRLVGISPYSNFAQNAGLAMAEFGIYKNNSLKDASIFDFYNNLLDGDNKNEWQDFDVYNISLAQTFFNEKLGFDLTYNKEDYRNGQISLLTDWRQAIYVDINRIHEDGTTAGKNGIPYEDGTPNANLGRPFISDNGANGNNSYRSQRTSKRFTAFATHDFSRGEHQNLLTRILGKHTLTGLWAQDEQKTQRREWMRWAVTDSAYRAFINSTSNFDEGQTFIPSQVIYLGPSLLTASSASGANIQRPMGLTSLVSGTTRVFDSHWNGGNIDPAAPWLNTFYPSDQTAQYNSTQSENPSNYVGWHNIPLLITDSSTSEANRDLLTRRASMDRKRTTSKVLVWQAHMLDGGLVGTFGIRKDRAQGWSRSINTNSNAGAYSDAPTVDPTREFGYLNLGPSTFFLPTKGSDLEETSKSWSLVAHFDELPGLSRITAEWPVRVSAFYSRSENFQPEALRVNLFGEQLPLPKGATKDMGLMFETKDGKYSLRINKFTTDVQNASSSALNRAGFLGTALARGTNWANQFEYDLGIGNQPSNHIISAQVNGRPAGAPQPPGWTEQVRAGNPNWDPTNSLYNYGTDVGETQAMADAREKAAITAWRTFQNSVDPRFWKAWSMDLTSPFRQTGAVGLNASTPTGFAVTEDSSSKGYEIEFSAQPVRNWRFTLNAAKVEARRTNIGGKELTDFIAAYEKAIQTTAAGDIRIWWGTAANDTTLRQWYSGGEGLGGEWASRRLQEGTNVPELREWRVNAITNYDFTEGRFKGFSVGGGVRWQSDVVIGYKPIPGATAKSLSFELANPYMGPAETNFDFWVGYGRKVTEKIDWRIQLNVRNAFAGNDLIPITVQPDGTVATYRIAPPSTWTISNTFKF